MPPVSDNLPEMPEAPMGHTSPPRATLPESDASEVSPAVDLVPSAHSGPPALPQESGPADEPLSQAFDGIRQYFERLLDSGITILNKEEENWLSAYIDPEQEDQRELVYRLAKELTWQKRPHGLTSQLVQWVDIVDQNYEVAAQLLRERLDTYEDDPFDPMMSLNELDELMDLQLAYEDYKEKIQRREQDKKDEGKREAA
ncbi:hypothetical protein F4776DRAFT_663050 [Hypoxylon sp. NC0597]|nr:hypothetical protein F4776DRAFT_663050 [Hypoxylon sp. NC0597]